MDAIRIIFVADLTLGNAGETWVLPKGTTGTLLIESRLIRLDTPVNGEKWIRQCDEKYIKKLPPIAAGVNCNCDDSSIKTCPKHGRK